MLIWKFICNVPIVQIEQEKNVFSLITVWYHIKIKLRETNICENRRFSFYIDVPVESWDFFNTWIYKYIFEWFAKKTRKILLELYPQNNNWNIAIEITLNKEFDIYLKIIAFCLITES